MGRLKSKRKMVILRRISHILLFLPAAVVAFCAFTLFELLNKKGSAKFWDRFYSRK